MNRGDETGQSSDFTIFLKAFENQSIASKIFVIVFTIVFLPCAVVGFFAAWIKARVRPRLSLWVSVVIGFSVVGALAGRSFLFFEYLPFERTSVIISFAVSLLVSYLFAGAFLSILSAVYGFTDAERR